MSATGRFSGILAPRRNGLSGRSKRALRIAAIALLAFLSGIAIIDMWRVHELTVIDRTLRASAVTASRYSPHFQAELETIPIDTDATLSTTFRSVLAPLVSMQSHYESLKAEYDRRVDDLLKNYGIAIPGITQGRKKAWQDAVNKGNEAAKAVHVHYRSRFSFGINAVEDDTRGL